MRLNLACLLVAALASVASAECGLNEITRRTADGQSWECAESNFLSRGTSDVGANLLAVKSATETVTASAALQNDDHLFLALPANSTWSVEGFLVAFSTSATPGIKLAFTLPAGAMMAIGFFGNNGTLASALTGTVYNSAQSTGLIPVGASIDNPIRIRGTVAVGATPGSLQLQWAQSTSNGAQLHVRPRAHLQATRIQ